MIQKRTYSRVGLVLLLSLCMVEIAAATTDSTSVTPLASDTPVMTRCPKIVVSGVQLSATSQNVNLGPQGPCVTYRDTGTIVMTTPPAVGGIFGGGQLHPACPASHPYMINFTETWIAAGATGVILDYTCCQGPTPPMSADEQWVQGPNCP